MGKDFSELAGLFFEMGQLKRVGRSGWTMIGVKHPESVAEHTMRAALIGYFLAEMRGADSKKVALMLLLHDLPEARINDMHKVGAGYVDVRGIEDRVFREQVGRAPEKIRKKLVNVFGEFVERKSEEAVIAKDADLLECAVQAKEYIELGYENADQWISSAGKGLKTPEAKKILESVVKGKAHRWWEGLKK